MRNQKSLSLSLLVAVLLIIFPIISSAQVPKTINYQGYLSDSGGNPIHTDPSTISITFSIYDVATDGTALWTETQTVTVYNGIYSVVLGSVDTIGNPLDLPFDVQYWLGTTVDADNEMIPRMQFTAVPFAYRAVTADSVANNSVTALAIEDNAIVASKIAAGAVGSAQILDSSVTAVDLAPGVIPDEHSLDAADGSPIDAVYVDNIGNVGIGTTSPSTELHVEGVIKANAPGTSTGSVTFSGPNGNPGIGFYSNEPEGFRANIARATTGLGIGVHADTTNPGINELFIANDGNVGIGTTSPGAKLDVSGIARVSGNVWPTSGNGMELAYNASLNKGYLQVYDRNAGRWGDLYLGNGNVGIGTKAPNYKLDVRVVQGNGAVHGEYDSGARTNEGLLGTLLYGVWGRSTTDQSAGVYGEGYYGVQGYGASSPGIVDGAGVFGYNDFGYGVIAGSTFHIGLLAYGDKVAAKFFGNVEIYGDGSKIMELGKGLDYAEGFDVSSKNNIGPGSVVVIDNNNPGKLTLSIKEYDIKVAGIVSGAKGLGSGVRLGADNFDYDVALAGRVYCNVSTTKSRIIPGDLLTTSNIPGYAMKAIDYQRAQGAILGKAMEGLEKGRKGQILVLVTLQ